MKKLNKADLHIKARYSAFRLLKFRLRSENEIRQHLKRKRVPLDIIEETIAFLKERRFIDDRHFAKLWLDSHLRRNLGLRRINRELRDKGIDSQVIKEIMDEARQGYSEDKVVYDLAQAKWEKLKSVDRDKARQRLYAWLLRRGFSADAVIEVIEKICKPIYYEKSS